MSGGSRRGPGRPRSAEADAAILRAAMDEFVERGIAGMSIEQVAGRAGVGKLTVYRRYSSKEDLVARAIEAERAGIPDAADERFAGVPLEKLIRRAIPAAADTMVEPRFRGMVAQVFGASVSHPSLLETYWEHYVKPRRAATRVLLERARAEGVLAPDADLDVLIDMMVGSALFRLLQPGPLDAKQMRRYLRSVYRQAGLL